MKIIELTGHQGDCQFAKIESIPHNAKKCNKMFIAKSEQSGSVHALSGNYEMYEIKDGFILDCKEECVLNHTFKNLVEETLDSPKVLPKKDHRHSILPPGTYAVGIQQRFDPMENMKKKVVD